MRKKYIIAFLLLLSFPLLTVNATTLRDYKNKVAELQNKQSENSLREML